VDGTEARCRTVEEIAHLYLAEMRTVQPNGPYFIGGYCFGGSVAWEIAQRLKRDGEAVKLLALLEPALNLPGAEGSSAPNLHRSSDHKFSLRVHLSNLRGLNPQQQWSYVWSRVHNKLSEYLRIPRPAKDITKAFVCTAFLRLGYRIPYSLRSFYILRLYTRALEKYNAQIYPGSVLIIVSAGSADPAAWSRLATGDVKLFEIPADHMEIRKGPFVQAWAEELRDSLRAAQTERSISSTQSSVLERETTYVADSEAKKPSNSLLGSESKH
jgi:aspartate racemase